MPQFRLTEKYAKDCRINNLSAPQSALHLLDDWFIDVIRVNRKKVAMATHAQSAFTFLIPYAEIGGAVAIPEGIGILLKELLYENDLSAWAEQVDRLFYEPAIFCKTVNRSILGHMNDFSRLVKGYADHYASLHSPISWDKMTKKINRTPINFATTEQSLYPVEILGKLIGHSLS